MGLCLIGHLPIAPGGYSDGLGLSASFELAARALDGSSLGCRMSTNG